MNFKEFLSWEAVTDDTIDFKKTYVDVAGDLNAGLLLSEIVYWYLPSRESGRSKLRVEQEGQMWIACRRYEWWKRTRLTPKQADAAIKRLEKAGLVVKKVFKFKGEPTVHVRLNEAPFLKKLEYINENPPANPHLPIRGESIAAKGENVLPDSGRTNLLPAESPYTKISPEVSPEHFPKTLIDPLTGSDRAGGGKDGLEANAKFDDAIAKAWRTKAPAFIAQVRQTLLCLHPFGSTDFLANVSPAATADEIVDLGDYFHRLNPSGKMPTAPAKIQKWMYELRDLIPSYLCGDGSLSRFATWVDVPREMTDEDEISNYISRYYPDDYQRYRRSVDAYEGDDSAALIYGWCSHFYDQSIELYVPIPRCAIDVGVWTWLKANHPKEYARHEPEKNRIRKEAIQRCAAHKLSRLLQTYTGMATVNADIAWYMTSVISEEFQTIGVTITRLGGLLGEWDNVPRFSEFVEERIPQLLAAQPDITCEGILKNLRQFGRPGPELPGYWEWTELM